MLKFYSAVNQSKERIVRANAHIFTGMNAGTTLPHQNIAGNYSLTVRLFDAKTFGFAVTAVFRRTNALFYVQKTAS